MLTILVALSFAEPATESPAPCPATVIHPGSAPIVAELASSAEGCRPVVVVMPAATLPPAGPRRPSPLTRVGTGLLIGGGATALAGLVTYAVTSDDGCYVGPAGWCVPDITGPITGLAVTTVGAGAVISGAVTYGIGRSRERSVVVAPIGPLGTTGLAVAGRF